MMMFGMRDSGSKNDKIESLLLRPGTRILRPGLLLAGLLGLSFVAAACASGDDGLSGTAGMMRPDSIGGVLFEDGDGDGQQGEGEGALGGVDVMLMQDGDGDGTCETRIGSVSTGEDGSYLFEGVGAGSYCLAYGGVIGDPFRYDGGEGLEQGLGVQP